MFKVVILTLRLRRTTVTSVMTGVSLTKVNWLTSEYFQLLSCAAWYFVLLCTQSL